MRNRVPRRERARERMAASIACVLGRLVLRSVFYTRVRAVRELSFTANFFSMLAVCTIFTAGIAHLLFSKRGRIRRTSTDRLCFEALCSVCVPAASTRNTTLSTQGVSTQGTQCTQFEY